MRVRPAVKGDVSWVLLELREFSKEVSTIIEFFPEDEQDAIDILEDLVEFHVFLVAETEDGVGAGFIAGALTPHVLNPKILACCELFWWVRKEFRGSRAALMLIDEYTEFCKAEADTANFALLESSPKLDKSLWKRGWVLTERHFTLKGDR